MQCDVVVVGAGPGGSAAAYWLARYGIDVLLVDKAHFPRSKPCGDGLTPHAVSMLEAMGLDNIIGQRGRTFAGVRVFAPDGRVSLFTLPAGNDGMPQQGLIISRCDLDDIMRQQAVATGCRFLPGFTALSPHYHKGQLAGVEGHCGGHPLTIRARLVILATGAIRVLAETLGLPPTGGPSGLAMRAYFTGVSNLDEYLEIYLQRDWLPGYFWIFPTAKETANVGVGIRLDSITPGEGGGRLRAAFERFAQSDRLAGGRLLGQVQGFALRTDFPAMPTFTYGVLVVGEAAGLVNPLTGEGIALALESGQLAAEVANQALCSGDVSCDRLRQYDEVLRQRYAGYFNDAHELMARLTHPTIMETIIKYSLIDDRVREALTTAVLHKQPRQAITLLGTVLDSDDGRSPVGPLFAINAYKPLLDHCRAVMLAQVSLDTPSPLLLQMLARGKMLRALLVFLGYQAADGDPAQVVAGAAGIELVHAASLIHDDIMDNAQMRRGLPALHVALGIPRAIVCGDYLIAKAFHLLAEMRATSPPIHVVEAFIIGAESGIHTCAGQFQDVGLSAPEMLDEGAYDQLVAGKTASVIAGALKTGAALAGGDGMLLETLAQYGMCVGRAFQIKDDILDFTTISDNNGVTDRRATLPLIHAFRHSDALGQELIRQFYNGQQVIASELSGLVQATGSLIYAEQVAGSLVEESIRLVEVMPKVGKVLKAFARYAMLRDH